MGRVFVIGVGMTKFEKPGKRDDDYPGYAKEAILKALDDAKVKMTDIEQATAGYVYGDSTCGQRAIYEVGMTGIPIYNVNNNCATGATALLLAKQFIEFGQNQCVLAVGFEKMERGSLAPKFMDRTNPIDKHMSLMIDLAGINKSPPAAQMFGNAGVEHMKKYGTTLEHFAKIGYKNHKHSVNNPYSQFQDEYTLEQIMASPKVFGLLTKLQCCPTSDGSACAILASEDFVKKHGLEAQAVEIVAMEMATDLETTLTDNSLMKIVGYDMTKTAAEKAYAKSGIRPTDVQVVELHDCFSVNELITYEALGLCPPGKAGEMIDRGDNTYGGKYVVNPSGGLISKGHPLGATGLAQCAELCWQLRGLADKRQVPGAKLALQHNLGIGGAVVVGIYRHGFPEHLNRTISTLSPRFVAMATTDEGFKVAPYLRILNEAFQLDDDNLVEKFRGLFGFKVKRADGTEGFWLINTKEGKGKVEFNSNTKPDVTFMINDDDVSQLVRGDLNPQKAFFAGKIKVQGNMGVAMKLTQLQSVVKSELEKIRSKL
ncbi:sterol carrier protein 2-like isoform X2 [Onthophagus taurus]|uniref:sterol carrier protein 2-like isoform X2 n=1 Tax=Onthophagus taurus TaxID=166361 RepID=UPI0039BE3219